MPYEQTRGDWEQVKDALGMLPVEYSFPNNEFLEANKDAIEILKGVYAEKGGLHRLIDENTDEEYGILVRIPPIEKLNKIMARAGDKEKRKEPLNIDLLMVVESILWPKAEVFEGWVNGNAPGIAVPFSTQIMKLSGSTSSVSSEKLWKKARPPSQGAKALPK